MQHRSIGVKKSKSDPIAPTTCFSIHPVNDPIANPATSIGTKGQTSAARIAPRFHQHKSRMTAGNVDATDLLRSAATNNAKLPTYHAVFPLPWYSGGGLGWGLPRDSETSSPRE